MKNKKKRDAKKAKKLEEGEEHPKSPSVLSSVTINLTGDPEHDKKLKNIKKVYLYFSLKFVFNTILFSLKKLDAIEKLKVQQAEGKPMEINQLEKMKCEGDLLKELEQLTM